MCVLWNKCKLGYFNRLIHTKLRENTKLYCLQVRTKKENEDNINFIRLHEVFIDGT